MEEVAVVVAAGDAANRRNPEKIDLGNEPNDLSFLRNETPMLVRNPSLWDGLETFLLTLNWLLAKLNYN